MARSRWKLLPRDGYKLVTDLNGNPLCRVRRVGQGGSGHPNWKAYPDRDGAEGEGCSGWTMKSAIYWQLREGS